MRVARREQRGPERSRRAREDLVARLRRRVAPGQGEEGMTLVELMVALTVLALVIVGLDLTIGLSYKIVQLGRSRTVAEATANRRLEEWRDVDYAQLALATQPTHSTDTDNPDYYVSSDGTQFDVTGNGDFEPLVVDTTTPGPVPHIESPVTVGATVVDVYNFVTWVDDPSIAGTQNLKRISVLVQYHQVGVPGTNRILRESVLFTNGTVTVPEVATTTTSTTAPAGTTTTSTPSGSSGCGSFSIAGSSSATAGYTATPTVTLTLSFPSCGGVIVNFSNDATTWSDDITYDSLNPTLAWSLSNGDGTKTVYGRARPSSGGTTWDLTPQSVILDTVKPTTPGTLSRTVSCSGSTRTTVLSWGASTDTYFVGYRLYRSTDGVTWQVIPPTLSTLTTSDSTDKTLTSVRYYITGYDTAGNESDATNIITLSKNQCS